MVTCGIDYSMTCPAVCLYTPSESRFWYAHESKSWTANNLSAFHITTQGTNSQRAARLAQGLLDWFFLYAPKVKCVSIEDYAFAATGRVYHIGENTGILKHFLETRCLTYRLIPPTVAKKFATGKGNADKPKMVAAFLDKYPIAKQWITGFFPRVKDDGNIAKSPLADLADAYWLARYSYENVA